MTKEHLEGVHTVVKIFRDLLLTIILLCVLIGMVGTAKVLADRMKPAAAPAEVVRVRAPGECGPGELFDWSGGRC